MLDAIGYVLVALLIFGFPLYFVGYGIYVAFWRGVDGQPSDTEMARPGRLPDRAEDHGELYEDEVGRAS